MWLLPTCQKYVTPPPPSLPPSLPSPFLSSPPTLLSQETMSCTWILTQHNQQYTHQTPTTSPTPPITAHNQRECLSRSWTHPSQL